MKGEKEMATKYEEELEKAKLQTEQNQLQQHQNQLQQKQNEVQQNALKGVSSGTQQKLSSLSQGYTPSQNVSAAQQYLQSIVDKKPGEYTSQYAPQITELYDQLMGRGKFRYDMNADPLFQQYKNSYMQTGRQAMEDTIGNMATLTGGYGNSFAGAAAQQQYQQYLTGLHDVIPQLQQQEYERYRQEGQDLQNLLAITQGLDDAAYGRYRDTVGDWQSERAYAQGAYESAYDREYNDYVNQLNYWQQQGRLENQDYWTQQEYDMSKTQAERDWELAQKQMQLAQGEFDLNKTQAERDWEQAQLQMKLAQGEFGITERSTAFDQAIAMMQMGMTPNAELLAMAGLTEADAQAYLALLRGNGSGGSGGRAQTVEKEKTYNKDLVTLEALGAIGADPTKEQLEALGLTEAQYANYMAGAMLPRKDISQTEIELYPKILTGEDAPSSVRIQQDTKKADKISGLNSILQAKNDQLLQEMKNIPIQKSDEEEYDEILKMALKGR